jgi:hypothetical protein
VVGDGSVDGSERLQTSQAPEPKHRPRCCQTNANQSPPGQSHCPLSRAKTAPLGECGGTAALDIRDLRSLVDCIRLVRRTAMQTAVRMITTGACWRCSRASPSS